MTASLTLKTYDTYPAWTFSCNDANGWVAIAGNTTAIRLVGKGNVTNTLIGPVTATAVTEQAFTGNITSGSNVIQSVSAFTGISVGSTIVGAGIPINTIVGSFDSTALTITLTDTSGNPANATKTATGESLTANRGQVTYTPTTTDTGTADTYAVELSVTWTVGGGVQKFPNAAANNPLIEIDSDLDGASG